MSTTLRALAVASCTAIIVAGAAAGTATVAGASGSAAFTVSPGYGPVGTKITLTGADFNGDNAVTIGGVAATDFHLASSHEKVTAVVPSGAKTGLVAVSGTNPLTGPTYTVQQATRASASLSHHLLVFPHTLVVAGVLTVAASGKPVAGQTAELQHRLPASTSWHHAKGTVEKKTGPHGVVKWRVTPVSSGAFRVHFLRSPKFTKAITGGHAVRVAPKLHLQSMHTVPALSASQIVGTIRPSVDGVVHLQRYVNGAWHAANHTTVVGGHFSFTISPSALGSLRYRVVWRSDGLHATSTTHTLHLQVVHRELVLGDTGPDVRQLQKRLRQLHYDLGSVSGSYEDDTLHAVTAFEKVQGLTPDGEVGAKVWKALNHPKLIHLRYPDAGTYEVEVNIGKQVLLLGKNGHVFKILDTSTAGGYLYTNSEGGTSRAITPTGHFSIQYKLTGTRVSKLGTLYYPSYFTNTGYAIHGEGNGNDGGEVPPYPNSHGCVRITDNAVLRYFNTPWLAVGTSVWIYH